MVINSLIAENVLKYAHLELKELPTKGLIAISGLNESGKSTIGETICFALFGRTFCLVPEHLTKVIRWGEILCSTSIEFTTSSGKRYQLVRHLDDDGNQGARLTLVGQEQPIARGIDNVNSKLTRFIGFGYPEFIESFYLAQREITTPHPHSVAVKTMAGVATLEQVGEVLRNEIAEHKTIIDNLEQELAKLREQISRLDIQEERLAALENERRSLAAEKSQKVNLVDRLRVALQACQNSVARVTDSTVQIDATERSRRTSQGGSLLLLLLAIVAWVVWVMFVPSSGSQNFWLLGSALVLSLCFIMFWVRSKMLGTRLARLEQDTIEQVTSLETVQQDLVDKKQDHLLTNLDSPFLDAERLRYYRGRMSELAQHYAIRVEPLHNYIESQEAVLNHEIEGLTEKLEGLDAAIAEERARRKQAKELEGRIEETQTQIDDHGRQIKIREYALDLLAGACREISRRFNIYVGSIVRTILPSLTDNCYEYLKIDENLNVRLFSIEKHDFIDVDEISGGTQRQTMLGVRLALSKTLIESTIYGAQFIFLDEPFVFSDQQRMHGTIDALRKLSDNFPQVFLIAQEFPEGSTFDKHIICKREVNNLVVEAG